MAAAIVIALAALFVALSGTAVAAGVVPLARRALIADNAKKVGGQKPAQLLAKAAATSKQQATAAAAAAAQQPGPASTAVDLLTTKTAPFSLPPGAEQAFTAACDAGSKASGGGFINPTPAPVLSFGSAPSADGSGWVEGLVNLSDTTTGTGSVVAVCVK